MSIRQSEPQLLLWSPRSGNNTGALCSDALKLRPDIKTAIDIAQRKQQQQQQFAAAAAARPEPGWTQARQRRLEAYDQEMETEWDWDRKAYNYVKEQGMKKVDSFQSIRKNKAEENAKLAQKNAELAKKLADEKSARLTNVAEEHKKKVHDKQVVKAQEVYNAAKTKMENALQELNKAKAQE